jgi:hypothetical protein
MLVWFVAACSLVVRYCRTEGGSSKYLLKSLNFYQTTRRNKAEDKHLQIYNQLIACYRGKYLDVKKVVSSDFCRSLLLLGQ